MSSEPEWAARRVRVEVRHNKEHPYGIIFVDGRELPYVTRVEIVVTPGDLPKVIVTMDVFELAVDVEGELTTEKDAE